MNVQNVSSCLQQCKNYKNRVCFFRVVITNVQLTFFSHPVYVRWNLINYFMRLNRIRIINGQSQQTIQSPRRKKKKQNKSKKSNAMKYREPPWLDAMRSKNCVKFVVENAAFQNRRLNRPNTWNVRITLPWCLHSVASIMTHSNYSVLFNYWPRGGASLPS